MLWLFVVTLSQWTMVEVVFDERVALVVIEEIESTRFVRAVVRTVTSADATVVCHRVQAVFGVNRGVDRANRFTRSRLTLHTSDGLWNEGHVVWIELVFLMSRKITIHANPVHFTAFGHLHFTDDGNVVFGLASDKASVATHTGRKVNRHTPLMKLIAEQGIAMNIFLFVERNIFRRV